ncbi:ATPase (plasmid) [Fulvitalea axinellae]|uniref:ATPase n=1 Tax=Fulvitalea axinellae TaxID=1182444 RepID=A0AAU9D2M6_9BACT|nr:ATPase [Fulvitalea axinellae]
MDRLKSILRRIDGRGYKAYQDIKGRYDFGGFDLEVLRVQGDPFAGPSLIGVTFDLYEFGYDDELYENESRKVGLADFVHRKALKAVAQTGKRRGSGKSGRVEVYRVGQEVLRRSAVEITDGQLRFLFYVGLPAAGRRVLGREASEMFCEEIPDMIDALRIETDREFRHALEAVRTNETADKIRQELRERNLLAFIANGSKLARRSSVDDRPMEGCETFVSPKSLETSLEIDGKTYTGMGLPKGITVITGGGFHGKSTLLNALERGVYNHIPGDGRELCITDEDSVKVRAEDGRFIGNLDISPFINNLPQGKDTSAFSTENASGSTSQAANIIEAIECGAKALLIDEDTSAGNFMVRDHIVQSLIAKEKEPITAYIERVRAMWEHSGISSVLVIGGLGDYFAVADHVLMLDEYKVLDVSERAKELANSLGGSHLKSISESFGTKPRAIDISIFRKELGGRAKMKTRGLDEISLNREAIDIRAMEQLVEEGQASLIGDLMMNLARKPVSNTEIGTLTESLIKEIEDQGFNKTIGQNGQRAIVRKYELASAIVRWRKNAVRQ